MKSKPKKWTSGLWRCDFSETDLKFLQDLGCYPVRQGNRLVFLPPPKLLVELESENEL